MDYRHFNQSSKIKYNYITKEGLDRLKEKLYILKLNYTLRCQKLKKMDAKDKFEYIASNNEMTNLQYLEKLINDLSRLVINARIIKKKRNSRVGLGSEISLEFGDKSINYTIVEPVEADSSINKISANSPIGQALLGKKINQMVSLPTRKGGIGNYKLKSIS